MASDEMDTDRLICKLCDMMFEDDQDLQLHIGKIHEKQKPLKPFECSVCGKRFKFLSILKTHVVVHSDERPFKCRLCDKGFKLEPHLAFHMATHTTDQPYSCEHCGKKFKTEKYMKTHHCENNTNKQFNCKLCSEKFCTLRKLKSHMLKHTSDRPYACETCGKTFKSPDALYHHVQYSHSETRSYKCKLCDSSFVCQTYLTKHMITHSDEYLHQCKLCDSTFKVEINLRKHMVTHDPDRELFKCETCFKKLKSKENLKKHILLSVCSKVSGSNTSLSSKNNLNKDKYINCKLCGKKLGYDSLKSHMKQVHTDEKPSTVTCTVCNKRLKSKLCLNSHMKVHNPNRRLFECENCGYKCKSKQGFRVHLVQCPTPTASVN